MGQKTRGLIGIQMCTIKEKVAEMGAYEVLKTCAEMGYHCIEISQIPMTAENVAEIRRAFANIYWRKVTDAAGLAQETASLPHGALLLLDGSELSACCDLSGLREDIQIMAAGNFRRFNVLLPPL